MKVLAMLQRSEIPPLAGFKSLNPKIPSLEPSNICIDTDVTPWDNPVKVALVNSYGASGSNAALLCSEAPKSAGRAQALSATLSTQYPVFLSAENVESLEAYAAKLCDWIQKTPDLRPGDLAYTLHERRKHHRVRWVGAYNDLGGLLRDLQPGLSGAFEVAPSEPQKPVVLVFSGQSKQTIQLEASWFCSFPQLRKYLWECASILDSLGYPAILPVLFQKEPIEDVVALQCGTFAVQYACAKCWIEAGVEVSAVVGHSFGELTALAVSSVLSLEDAVRLVASRATLMRTKWGPERGTMLAVHASRKVVEDLVAAVPAVEIACFNGPKSQVIVGTASAIESVQQVLDKDSRFARQNIRHQRVNTSHGFHSVFTEPMLEDIDEFSEGLSFCPGNIPIESCTLEHLHAISHKRIGRHTREPVYFEEAITRLEKRLGSCVFLEAGLGSPIVSMTKKAVQDPSRHVFIAGGPKSDKPAELAAMTIALWRQGIPAAFWTHIPGAESADQPVWLPPYQFRRQKHWLPYADYSDKSAKPVGQHGGPGSGEEHDPLQLVTSRGRPQDSWSSLTFDINPRATRFIDVVSGHAVRGQPLCPASMYMECAAMAARIIEPGLAASTLRWEDLSFQAGLGLNPNREVTLVMDGAGEYLSWNFTVNTVAKQHKGGRPTTHAKGRLSVVSPTEWQIYGRVIAECAQSLRTNPDADRVSANRAYTLFSRVVTYDSVMRGIRQVFMLGNQAVADVETPAVPPRGAGESTVVAVCDAVALDTFIQVSGLLVNSSDTCPVDEVYIATKIDNLSIQGCDFTDGHNSEWVVYVTTEPLGDSRVACDVFVMDKAGKLVMTVSGVQFTRFPIHKLEKVLQHAQINVSPAPSSPPEHSITQSREHSLDGNTMVANTPSTQPPEPIQVLESATLGRLGLESLSTTRLINQLKPNMRQITETTRTVEATSPDENIKRGGDTNAMHHRHKIIELISENSGSSVSSIADTVALQDMGIDSLSIVELKSSIEEVFGKQFGPDDMILGSTLKEILDLVDHNAGKSALLAATTVVAF
jgi:acyl transferase domain-containing protein/acyl carrier protein